MHNYRNRLIVKGHGVFIQPEIIKHVGGRACAQLLQQIHYWLTADCKVGVTHKNQKWVYNTLEDWAQTLGYSTSTIKNCIRYLKQQQLIFIEKLSNHKSNRTNFYTINYHQLNSVLENKGPAISCMNPLKKEPLNLEERAGEEELLKTKIITSQDKNCPMVIQETTNKSLINSYKSENSNEKVDKINLLKEMLKIWNETVSPEQLTHLTKKRCQFMRAVLKNIFQGNLKNWQNYCQLISSSDFLMGKVKSTFKASLDWALKFETIQKILEGQYGVKKSLQTEDQEDLQAVMEREIENTSDSQRVKTIKKLYLKIYGPQHYKSWVSSHDLHLSCEEKELRISCPNNRYIQDKVTGFFRQQLAIFAPLGLERVIPC